MLLTIDHDNEYRFKTIRWDTIKQTKLGEWDVAGHRTEPPRHFFSILLAGPHARQPGPDVAV